MDGLTRDGWLVFPAERAVVDWLAHVGPAIDAILSDPEQRRQWLRHAGTWFAGVDVLANDAMGRVGQGPALTGSALDAAFGIAGRRPLHPGQVSVVYPGYPGRDPHETEASHRYRRIRAAAHVDGLLAIGPDRRRYLKEPHAFILGLPVSRNPAGSSPLTVWEGSHHLIGEALARALAPHPAAAWPNIDITDAYHSARRAAFDSCRRVEIYADPGEAILLHRHMLHGVAPWAAPAGDPRIVVYFRPCMDQVAAWL